MKPSSDYSSRFRILKGGKISLVVSALLGSVTLSFAAPSGGNVVSGSATISQNGKITNINQSTQKASINWQKFSIASDETVNFIQPNINSITLNRVIGNEKSIINGALNATGQVWILNSNGVLFGKDAKINTSGLLATTKELSDTNFQNSNYTFTGNSTSSVINQGTIKVQNSGYVVLASNEVKNSGSIEAIRGKVHLTGANEYTLNLNGNSLLNLTINKGVLDALVENSGTIVANGGEIYLTTNAVNELLRGVVNNTGIIEANSLDGVTGYVELFAKGGEAQIGGTITALEGFVETSGETLSVDPSTKVIADTWLLDPTNIVIESTGGSDLTGASISATAIQNNLATTNIELQADEDITVNENITWAEATKLTLTAGDEIYVNSIIKNTNSTDGGVYFNAANRTSKVIFGGSGKVVINNVNQLQWMDRALNGKYELGNDIDASDTVNWNSGAGFDPIGDNTNQFTGTFDGLGHTIDALVINRPTESYIGLFGYTNNGSIKNIGLTNIYIKGNHLVGALVGENNTLISNSYSSGKVIGLSSIVGGLIGRSQKDIINCYSSANVEGYAMNVGGLIGGLLYSTLRNSYSTGTVYGKEEAAGLVAYMYSSDVYNSYSSSKISGEDVKSGLVSQRVMGSYVFDSYWDKETSGLNTSNGGIGLDTKQFIDTSKFTTWDSSIWTMLEENSSIEGYGIYRPFLKNLTQTSDKQVAATLFESGFGNSANPFIIKDVNQLKNIGYNSDTLSNNYYYNLGNDIDTSSIANFDPLGDSTIQFTGTFDGLGYIIDKLVINRSGEDYVGLFGFTHNATIKNIGLTNVNITGHDSVGGLVGASRNRTITNTYVTGSVNGNKYVGGLVGDNIWATITNSYATGNVTGNMDVGGLAGRNQGTIKKSYAIANVTGTSYVNGLVGYNSITPMPSIIEYSYASGTVNGQVKGLTTEEFQQLSSFDGFDIVEDSTISSSYKYPVLSVFNGGGSSTWKIYKALATASSSNSTTQQTQINKIITSIVNNQVLTNTDLNTLLNNGVDIQALMNFVKQSGGNLVIIPSIALKVLSGGINLPFGTQRVFNADNTNNNNQEEERI